MPLIGSSSESSWDLWEMEGDRLGVRAFRHPFVVVHVAFHLSGYTKLQRRRCLPVFSFTGSVACKKLTG